MKSKRAPYKKQYKLTPLNKRIEFEKRREFKGDFASEYEYGILEGLIQAQEIMRKSAI